MDNNNRPLVFVDLDDTLFQTARKMPEGSPRTAATLDTFGQPNGFMSPVQNLFSQWLLSNADVVPVTARSVEAFGRVKLPFTQGAICSNGGVMLAADGTPDRAWHDHMTETLCVFQDRLPALCAAVLSISQALGYSLRSWVVEEDGLNCYVVSKHNGACDAVLSEVLAEVRHQELLADMYTHINGNNLALLPSTLSKRLAVQEWLRRDRCIRGERPVLGFGDSITDLGFMEACHMWATPTQSQLAKAVLGLTNA